MNKRTTISFKNLLITNFLYNISYNSRYTYNNIVGLVKEGTPSQNPLRKGTNLRVGLFWLILRSQMK